MLDEIVWARPGVSVLLPPVASDVGWGSRRSRAECGPDLSLRARPWGADLVRLHAISKVWAFVNAME
ncbi:hypothetical protein GCM10010191_68280 [Actinomadura vinacea]|uniref:Uncharacterized protein n=1 Tax=Actinomadura vinacea TaxID=115336 RepID=A0ABN3JWF2_9ACTN